MRGRYRIGQFIDNGSFGQVYQIEDQENGETKLIIKIVVTNVLFDSELKTMKEIFD